MNRTRRYTPSTHNWHTLLTPFPSANCYNVVNNGCEQDKTTHVWRNAFSIDSWVACSPPFQLWLLGLSHPTLSHPTLSHPTLPNAQPILLKPDYPYTTLPNSQPLFAEASYPLHHLYTIFTLSSLPYQHYLTGSITSLKDSGVTICRCMYGLWALIPIVWATCISRFCLCCERWSRRAICWWSTPIIQVGYTRDIK